jgi:hypothetical protein
LDRNGLSVSTETACRFQPKSPAGNSEICSYDFEVTVSRQAWQIEVKASLNDPQAFEMGETEVRAGRAAARARSGVQYWIAYVSHISTPP